VSKPLVIDLCCGLGGWTRGFLAEGYDAIGFDIEKHEYGDKRYPAELILKDIRQLCGYELRAVNPVVIVASPPCQKYSYMAMPWKRAKREGRWQQWERDSPFGDFRLNELFDACFRIARECGVPLVVENVKGAQPWVGPARAHFGSYYLWGDVESVGGRIVGTRPQFGQSLRVARRLKVNPDGTNHGQGSWFAIADSKNRGAHAQKVPGMNFHDYEKTGLPGRSFQSAAVDSIKNDGGSWFNQAHNTESGVGQNPVNGVKRPGMNWSDKSNPDRMFNDPNAGSKGFVTGLGKGHNWRQDPIGQFNSKSNSRKAASAMIAEIPFDLAQWVARCFKPPLLTSDTSSEHNDFEVGTPQHLVE
jgi:hypothetical protein